MDSAVSSEVKLSIIVPCYKVEAYLPACLDSLMAQTLDGVEAICINDGSPDRCIDILRDYESRYPGRVVVIDKENEGVWKGRMDGIDVARGEYIGFLDSDDVAQPDFAEKLYWAAKSGDADIAVGGFSRIDRETGHVYSVELADERKPFSISDDPGRIIELNGAPWNKVFRAELLKTMHRLEFPPPVLDDLLFHLLVYPHADRVVFTPHSLVDYLVRSDSIITNIKPEVVPVVYDAFIAVKRYYIGIGAPEELQQALDAVAFLHTGISLMHRLSKSDPAHIDRYVKNNTQFLENFFPTWRKSPYATFGYARPRGLAYMKFLVAHRLYTRGLISTFFKAYSFMIERLGIDIKW